MEIELWRAFLKPYELAVRELTIKFEHLASEYRESGRYCPIEQVTGRVKSIPSILEKARRKNIDLSDVENEMFDIAGVRLICQFVEDIAIVAEQIKDRTDMQVVDERDYVSHVKESGYRSYHLIIRYRVQTLSGPKDLFAEIQIRTLGMNFWSIIEHSIQYKYDKQVPENISRRLIKAAQALVVLDSQMSDIRAEIMDAQISMQYQSILISDILTNIESLYRRGNRMEVRKIVDEFRRIYDLHDLELLERFARELDILSEGQRAQTLSESGGEPL